MKRREEAKRKARAMTTLYGDKANREAKTNGGTIGKSSAMHEPYLDLQIGANSITNPTNGAHDSKAFYMSGYTRLLELPPVL